MMTETRQSDRPINLDLAALLPDPEPQQPLFIGGIRAAPLRGPVIVFA